MMLDTYRPDVDIRFVAQGIMLAVTRLRESGMRPCYVTISELVFDALLDAANLDEATYDDPTTLSLFGVPAIVVTGAKYPVEVACW